jgi:ribonuclease HI
MKEGTHIAKKSPPGLFLNQEKQINLLHSMLNELGHFVYDCKLCGNIMPVAQFPSRCQGGCWSPLCERCVPLDLVDSTALITCEECEEKKNHSTQKRVTYAVRKGLRTGLFDSWDEVAPLVTGFRGAQYKKFASREEAEGWMVTGTVATAVKRKAEEPLPSMEEPVVKKAKVEARTVVYCDGGCRGNGTKEARASIGVYFGDRDPRNQSSLLPTGMKVSNQTAELYAAITTLRLVPVNEPLLLVTDSMYTINAGTRWRTHWKEKGWEGLKLKNIDLFRQLSDLIDAREAPLEWEHVTAHSGVKGNEAADQLASAALLTST